MTGRLIFLKDYEEERLPFLQFIRELSQTGWVKWVTLIGIRGIRAGTFTTRKSYPKQFLSDESITLLPDSKYKYN